MLTGAGGGGGEKQAQVGASTGRVSPAGVFSVLASLWHFLII